MRNIAIVVDSTTLLSKELKEKDNVYMAPLSVIVNEKEYQDLIDLKEEDWISFLYENATMTTSQPQTQVVVDIFNEIKTKDYDFVYILSLTSHLSGTLNSFSIGIEMTDLQNYELIDTFTIAGPIGYMAEAILAMNEKGLSHEAIMKALEIPLNSNGAIISPATLTRLVKSGRMSKASGVVGSLLKLKPVLHFEHHMTAIEKLEVVRSDRKVYSTIIDHLLELGVNADEYILYFLNVDAKERVKELEERIDETFGGIEKRHNMLPGVIATHVGIGTVGIQFVKRVQAF
ncbi:MAG: DegV family protein [Erysipelothrix sp.]|nr:DegV family protein [Erysipelothrix sp.]